MHKVLIDGWQNYRRFFSSFVYLCFLIFPVVITAINWVPLTSFWGRDFCAPSNNIHRECSQKQHYKNQGTRARQRGKLSCSCNRRPNRFLRSWWNCNGRWERSWVEVKTNKLLLYSCIDEPLNVCYPMGWIQPRRGSSLPLRALPGELSRELRAGSIGAAGKWVSKSVRNWVALQNLLQYTLCYSEPLTFSIKLNPPGSNSFLFLGKLTEWRLRRHTAALATAPGHRAATDIHHLPLLFPNFSLTLSWRLWWCRCLPGRWWESWFSTLVNSGGPNQHALAGRPELVHPLRKLGRGIPMDSPEDWKVFFPAPPPPNGSINPAIEEHEQCHTSIFPLSAPLHSGPSTLLSPISAHPNILIVLLQTPDHSGKPYATAHKLVHGLPMATSPTT